jgi:dTDP-glucose 4,6-dehydratase
MNMFGERQHPEKCVPKVIGQMLRNEEVVIHGHYQDGFWTPCSRHWLHARVQANALLFLLEHGIPGEKYHIQGVEKTNQEIVMLIASILGKNCSGRWSEPLGPVHDMAYALAGSNLQAMGWKPQMEFDDAFRQTVLWTAQHPEWLEE